MPLGREKAYSELLCHSEKNISNHVNFANITVLHCFFFFRGTPARSHYGGTGGDQTTRTLGPVPQGYVFQGAIIRYIFLRVCSIVMIYANAIKYNTINSTFFLKKRN